MERFYNMEKTKLEIRKINDSDKEALWEIIHEIIADGDTWVFAPDSSKEKMLEYWFDADKHAYVAVIDNEIIGTFYFRNNQPDLGSHVANAGYMTSHKHIGKGIGKAMGLFSLKEAKRFGYSAMQFNYVVKSNAVAVKLWQSIGFEIVGEVPDAYQHAKNGLTNVFIMYRDLSDID